MLCALQGCGQEADFRAVLGNVSVLLCPDHCLEAQERKQIPSEDIRVLPRRKNETESTRT